MPKKKSPKAGPKAGPKKSPKKSPKAGPKALTADLDVSSDDADDTNSVIASEDTVDDVVDPVDDAVDDPVDDTDADVDEEKNVNNEAGDSDYEELDDDDATVAEEDLHSSTYYRTVTVVPDNKRMTSDIMTSFEFSEVIGIRMQQISEGGQVFTDTDGLMDPHDMAIKELFDRKCPLKIIRQISKFSQEEWKVNDMGFPADVRPGF